MSAAIRVLRRPAGRPVPPAVRVVGALVLLAAVGCSRATAPTAADLSYEVPAHWAADAAPATPRRAWLRECGDEELLRLVVEAWNRNPDLAATARRVEQAAAQARLAGAARWPQLGAEAGVSRSRRNAFDPGTGLVDGDEPVSALGYREPSWQRVYATAYDLGLSVAWEVDVWGKLAAERRAALAQTDGARATWDWARFSLGVNVARAWWSLVASERQLALTRATLASWRATERIARERFAAGLLPTAELHGIARAVELAEAGREELAGSRDAAARRLELLLGRYPAGVLSESAAVLPPLPGAVRAGLPSELLTRRPDLRAAALRVLAARERIWNARADLFPSIRLTAAGGYRSGELADLLDPEQLVWNLAGGIAAPLFDGDRRRATVDLRRAQAAEALESYRGSVLRAFGEVEGALVDEAVLRLRAERVAGALEAARAAEDLARERYRRGLEDVLVLQNAHRERLGLERQLLALRLARWQRRLDLYLALGGEPLLDGPEPEEDGT